MRARGYPGALMDGDGFAGRCDGLGRPLHKRPSFGMCSVTGLESGGSGTTLRTFA